LTTLFSRAKPDVRSASLFVESRLIDRRNR